MKKSLKWYFIFVACVLLIAIPIEYYEVVKFGPEIEPFNVGIVLLWVVLSTIMYGAIFLLRKRPWIWVVLITTWGFIFEFYLNPHQEAPLMAALIAWGFLFGVIPAGAIHFYQNRRKRVRRKS